jgi:peptidoglycan-associated lipoprotein
MKRWITIFAVAGLVAGCASAPKDEQPAAKVEDAAPPSASTTTAPPPSKQPTTDPTAKPIAPDTVGGDPLKDPANVLSRRSVYFDYDSNVVKEEFKPLVSSHAGYLSKNRNRRVTVQGNTDERGSREYNLALGQRRADAVKQMMTLLGAPGAQIETVSFGEEKPRQQGSTEQAFSENRRADIVYDGE